ncbi:MAG: PHP domain-containing protein [Anaerolineae bacterium]
MISSCRQRLLADLHVHSVASACAEIEMTPPLIVRRALQLGLGIVAITDHNSALNVAAAREVARGSGLTVWAGLEVQTREEAHIVCLFDEVNQAKALQETVEAHLPDEANPEEFFGMQLVVDARGELVRKDEQLRQVACDLSVEDTVALTRDLAGVAIAAHVDRPSYSLLASLGFVPEDLDLVALEVSQAIPLDEVPTKMARWARWAWTRSSDAHTLAQMLPCMVLEVSEPTVAEFELALRQESGRNVTLVA